MSGFGVGLRLDVSLIFWFVFRIPLCLCEVVSTPSLPGFRCVPITPAWGARRLSTAGRREGACHAPDAGRRWATGQRLRVSGKGATGNRVRVPGPAGVQQV